MKNCNTRDNHFVPEQYFQNFVFNDSTLYMLNLDKKEIRPIFSFEQICKQRSLYAIYSKITNDDIEFCLSLFKINFEDFTIFLTEIANLVNNNIFDNTKQNSVSRNQEFLYTDIENLFFENICGNIINKEEVPIYKNNYNIAPHHYIISEVIARIHSRFDKTSIYTQNAKLKEYLKVEYYDTIYYLMSQYFRTKKIISNLKNTLAKTAKKHGYNENLDNIIYLSIIILPIYYMDIMLSLNYHLVLIKNDTNINFLTSDNPSINTFNNVFKINSKDYNLEVYFPISSNLAILFTNKKEFESINHIVVNDIEEINKYNTCIIKNAEKYIYSNNKQQLKGYFS